MSSIASRFWILRQLERAVWNPCPLMSRYFVLRECRALSRNCSSDATYPQQSSDTWMWVMSHMNQSYHTYVTCVFLDGYCSTVQGLLDWFFEVDLGFTELLFIQIDFSRKVWHAWRKNTISRKSPAYKLSKEPCILANHLREYRALSRDCSLSKDCSSDGMKRSCLRDCSLLRGGSSDGVQRSFLRECNGFFWRECGALLREYRAFVREYRALLKDHKALLKEYRALFRGMRSLLFLHMALLMRRPVPILREYRALFSSTGLFRENIGLFWKNTGLYWKNFGLFSETCGYFSSSRGLF